MSMLKTKAQQSSHVILELGVCGWGDRQMPWSLWPGSLAKSVSYRFSETLCLNKAARIEKDACCLFMGPTCILICTRIPRLPHTHIFICHTHIDLCPSSHAYVLPTPTHLFSYHTHTETSAPHQTHTKNGTSEISQLFKSCILELGMKPNW